MSYFSNLMYDVETLFLDGKSAIEIADELDLPVEQIVAVLEGFGVQDAPEDYSPFVSMNS